MSPDVAFGFSCQQIVEVVTEYLDGGLAPNRLVFERHVAMCPPCRGYLEQLRRITKASGALAEEDLPQPLRANLMDAFRDWNAGSAKP